MTEPKQETDNSLVRVISGEVWYRARIEHDGKLMFTSTEYIYPFAGEPGKPVRIMVTKQ